MNNAIMDKYQVANTATVTGDGTNYYGYINRTSDWNFIMKGVVSAGITTFTYAVSKTGYSTNWTGRAGLNYFDFKTAWEEANLN